MALKELKIEAVLHKIKLRTYLLLIKPFQYVYLHMFSVYIRRVMHLKFIHKDNHDFIISLKNAKLFLMCGFIHGFVNISTYSQYTEDLIGFMLCHTTSNLPPNGSNRAFFIRLLQSLVPSVLRKKARRSECDLICHEASQPHCVYKTTCLFNSQAAS